MNTTFSVIGATVLIGGIVAIGLYAVPQYGVYSARMEGQSILAKAESAKRAQILDAEAKYESAKYLKQAADEIQSSLTPAYIDYLRVQMQEQVGEHNPNAVYFVPNTSQVVIPAK